MSVSLFRWILLCSLVIFACCTDTPNDAVPTKNLKILGVFGHLGRSHFMLLKPLVEELARRGHNVTVISHFPRTAKDIAADPLPNYRDISLLSDRYNIMVNVIEPDSIRFQPIFKIFDSLDMLYRMRSLACEAGLSHPRMKEFVESGEKFDLVLTENFNTHCFFMLFHRIGVPFIDISTHPLLPWVPDELGFSVEDSYIPGLWTSVSQPMDFLQRTYNVMTMWFTRIFATTVFHWHDQYMVRRIYGPEFPDLKEMSRNVSLVFVNTHYTLHGAQPFPPNVVEVGGLHIPPKTSPLPRDIAKFLDEAHEGVLYFNLGSMVKMATVSKDKLTILLNMFASIPRKVIWKWETDDLPQKPNNVLVKKWLPQYDIMSK
ncbi:PREDICTED: UDP-glucuronosyltransferase 2B15-like [Dufourea novaeangliae]|uniref:UDP-glucuronosyltransferase 2B15-like n=1 Tax=Dufourea novaeangliae TaxID=178035 RepID=UPI0007672F33|nr:PREDICTED: UDP-glucuronosyltransferase 2B15-like [Dufourea novaeangliae]